MPITESAKKRLRQNEKNAAANRRRKHSYKTAIRAVRDAVAAGDFAAAQKLLPAAYKAIDKAASRGPLHRNAASRRKSRLAAFAAKRA